MTRITLGELADKPLPRAARSKFPNTLRVQSRSWKTATLGRLSNSCLAGARSENLYHPPKTPSGKRYILRERDCCQHLNMLIPGWQLFGVTACALRLLTARGVTMLANTLVVLSSTAEDGDIEVRISVG
uniref:Uncharacterized protein n=1 Tax=Timema douglasi TaxID=61478 RepID=A0A7R8VWM9_TIMDO|nr:unnamed protein product [Timema douglasi]